MEIATCYTHVAQHSPHAETKQNLTCHLSYDVICNTQEYANLFRRDVCLCRRHVHGNSPNTQSHAIVMMDILPHTHNNAQPCRYTGTSTAVVAAGDQGTQCGMRVGNCHSHAP